MIATMEVPGVEASTREAAILEHLPQVSLIARRMHRGLPASVSFDDLLSAGTIGLIAAIDRYDPTQQVKLKTYAEHKIRGAILDSLRGLAWTPRLQRKRARSIEAAISTLETRHGRAAGEEEIAAHLGISLAEYHDWLLEARKTTIGSLEAAKSEEDGANLLRFLSDSSEHWPSTLLERAELQKLVAQALERIPRTEQNILSLYFHEDMTLREIAKTLNVHESRVSQLKSQALLRLRAQLKASWPATGSRTVRQELSAAAATLSAGR